MAQQKEFDPELSGAIFKNHDKQNLKGEKDTSNWAEYQGKIQVAGVEFYASLWVKEITKGKNQGDKFFSVALKPKDQNEYDQLMKTSPNQGGGQKPKPKEPSNTDLDDDLPF